MAKARHETDGAGAARAERLRQALRHNLRRRKEQARAQAAAREEAADRPGDAAERNDPAQP